MMSRLNASSQVAAPRVTSARFLVVGRGVLAERAVIATTRYGCRLGNILFESTRGAKILLDTSNPIC
jgi:hypothetical protein